MLAQVVEMVQVPNMSRSGFIYLLVIYLSARTVIVNLVVMQNTTPSGCACHPSTGGELPGARGIPPRQASLATLHRRGIPPRQAAPATSPQEGNTTPSGCAAECRRDAIAPVYLY